MKVLDLFSGIGGFSLGLERAGMETVAFCEIEDYPRKVLAKHWPNIPIYEDVRNVTRERLNADGIFPDVITGGFPCQDISVAGKQAGIDGERSGLWSECARILGEFRPRYAIFENVTALLGGNDGKWFERVLWDISQVGYDAEWHCIPASELGAHHHRDRVWIIAYPASTGGTRMPVNEINRCCGDNGGPATEILQGSSTDTNSKGLQRGEKFGIFGKGGERWHQLITGCFCHFRDISTVKPTIRRDFNGVSNQPYRINRVKGCGNAVVPQIPEIIGRAIMEIENEPKDSSSGLG